MVRFYPEFIQKFDIDIIPRVDNSHPTQERDAAGEAQACVNIFLERNVSAEGEESGWIG